MFEAVFDAKVHQMEGVDRQSSRGSVYVGLTTRNISKYDEI